MLKQITATACILISVFFGLEAKAAKPLIPMQETAIFKHLEAVYNSSFPDSSNRMSLSRLQSALYRRNITEFWKVPSETTDILQLLKSIPIDKQGLFLLEHGLGIPLPRMHTPLLVGYSYNLIDDRQLQATPFAMAQTDDVLSPLGYLMPDIYQVKVSNELHEVFLMYDSVSEYLTNRFDSKSLSIGGAMYIEGIPVEMTAPIGYNYKRENSSKTGVQDMSASHEQRLFKLILSPKSDKMKFNEEFVGMVQNLTKFDHSSCQSQEEWKHLFDSFGTHVVTSAYGGGCVDVVLRAYQLKRILSSGSRWNAGISAKIFKFFQLSFGGSKEEQTDKFLVANNIYKHVSFRGGDNKWQSVDFFNLSHSEKKECLNSWKDSVTTHPIMLDSKMSLEPLSTFLKLVDQAKTESNLNYESALLHWSKRTLKSCSWYNLQNRNVNIVASTVRQEGWLPASFEVKLINGNMGQIQNLRQGDQFYYNFNDLCTVNNYSPPECYMPKTRCSYYKIEYIT